MPAKKKSAANLAVTPDPHSGLLAFLYLVRSSSSLQSKFHSSPVAVLASFDITDQTMIDAIIDAGKGGVNGQQLIDLINKYLIPELRQDFQPVW